jgi:hypothetical protein
LSLHRYVLSLTPCLIDLIMLANVLSTGRIRPEMKGLPQTPLQDLWILSVRLIINQWCTRINVPLTCKACTNGLGEFRRYRSYLY